MPEDMSDRMPDRMPENLSDKISKKYQNICQIKIPKKNVRRYAR
jgi:hypothetical protein